MRFLTYSEIHMSLHLQNSDYEKCLKKRHEILNFEKMNDMYDNTNVILKLLVKRMYREKISSSNLTC